MLRAPKEKSSAPKEESKGESKGGYSKMKSITSPINAINDSQSMFGSNLEQSSFILDVAESKPLLGNILVSQPVINNGLFTQRSSTPDAPMMINTMSSGSMFKGGIMGQQ